MNHLSVRSLQSLLFLFLDKRDDFANENEEFYNPSIKKILVTINDMPHQLFAAGLQVREVYPELKKYFYKENSDVIWEDFLTTKFALWIDTRFRIYIGIRIYRHACFDFFKKFLGTTNSSSVNTSFS